MLNLLKCHEGVKKIKKVNLTKSLLTNLKSPAFIHINVVQSHKAMGMIGLVIVDGDTSNKKAIAKAKVLGKSKKKLKKLLGEI